MDKLVKIFKEYKGELLLIYLFMLITELSNLSFPFLLGKSIDGLINGNSFWLIFLAISFLSSNLFNYKRMVYDTKVYTKIYNGIVFKFLKKTNINTSTKIARTDMANNIVHVLEGYVHYYISTIVTIIGSIIFIFIENWKVGLLIAISLLFIIASIFVYLKKIKQSVIVLNNHNENKLKAIENGYAQSISFFNRKRKIEIYQSTIQGKNWLLVGLIKNTFLFLSIILLVTTTKNITIGGILTVYSYVNDFLIAILSLPVAVEMYSRLTDIIKRIH